MKLRPLRDAGAFPISFRWSRTGSNPPNSTTLPLVIPVEADLLNHFVTEIGSASSNFDTETNTLEAAQYHSLRLAALLGVLAEEASSEPSIDAPLLREIAADEARLQKLKSEIPADQFPTNDVEKSQQQLVELREKMTFQESSAESHYGISGVAPEAPMRRFLASNDVVTYGVASNANFDWWPVANTLALLAFLIYLIVQKPTRIITRIAVRSARRPEFALVIVGLCWLILLRPVVIGWLLLTVAAWQTIRHGVLKSRLALFLGRRS